MIDNGINIHFLKVIMICGPLIILKIGLKVYNDYQSFNIDKQNIIVGHGDGLGKGDSGYKIIKSIFKNKISQFLFRMLHPDLGMKLGMHLSRSNKNRRIIQI